MKVVQKEKKTECSRLFRFRVPCEQRLHFRCVSSRVKSSLTTFRTPAVTQRKCSLRSQGRFGGIGSRSFTFAFAAPEECIVKNQKILLNVRFFFSLKLSEDNSVRVSDVGISKEATEITGTIAGSPVYIAPEVFQSELYDIKADIYSLGIILWEVWYGEQAFSKILTCQPQQFFSFVAGGGRPKPLEGYSKPPWEALMKQCWEANPQNRPTAEECLKIISGLGGRSLRNAPLPINAVK